MMLGTRMLPLHFSIAPERWDNWKKGSTHMNTAKYIVASLAISSPPPSQKGSLPLIISPKMPIIILTERANNSP